MRRDVSLPQTSRILLTALSVVLAFTWLNEAHSQQRTAPLRVGIIGLDTSHVISFTRLINSPTAKGDLAKISIVGVGMRSHAGIASTMFEVLAKNGINIELISTSEIRITCIVHADQVANAVGALHNAFELDRED